MNVLCVCNAEATFCPVSFHFPFLFQHINPKCAIEIESSLLCLEETESRKRREGLYGAVAILRRFSGMVPRRIDYSPCMASHRAYNCCLFPTVISFTSSRGGDVLPCDMHVLLTCASPATTTEDAIITVTDSHISVAIILQLIHIQKDSGAFSFPR